MGRSKPLAFLSYSSRYAAWVAALHRDLESALGEGAVFIEKEGLKPGKSWVTGLQQGLDAAETLLLVVTPEAMASPRVLDEVGAKITREPHYKGAGSLIPLKLVDAPVPPFLEDIQWVDFTGDYREKLAELLEALEPGARPKSVESPEPPAEDLPTDLRGELIALVEGQLHRPSDLVALESTLNLSPNLLATFPSTEMQANAALVHARGDDEAPAAALRLLAVVERLFAPEGDAIDGLRKRLDALATSGVPTGLLGRYFDRVERDHGELVPYFRGPAPSPVLEHVYVELAIDPGRHEHELARGPLTLAELIGLRPDEHEWVTGRWVVRGDPGAGKTTLLRHYAHTLAKAKGGLVPLFMSLPKLLGDHEPLLDRVQRSLSKTEAAQGLTALLDECGQKGELVLLLDGLDEVPRASKEDAASLLRELDARWPDAPLVVATRPIGYEGVGRRFREVDVQPLDVARRREFLGRWFAGEGEEPDFRRADGALEQLKSSRGLWEIAGTPLYLTLIAILLAQDETPEARRSALYDQIFELLFEGRHKPEKLAMPLKKATRAVLRALAIGMTEDERVAEPFENLEARLYRKEMDGLRAELERHVPWRHDMRTFLNDLAERTGILGPHDGPEGDWRFWHKSFGEALTAEALEDRHAKGGVAACIEHVRTIDGDEGRWAEPYALLAGRVEEADELVRALVEVKRPLGLRALATAQGLKPGTLQEVLELSDDWEQRRDVIQSVVEQVRDPERGVRLLGRLAEATTDGNDLYFLDAAMKAAGEQHEDVAGLAGQLGEQLFRHLQRPGEGLFDWVDIEAGEFWMGSPEDEDGRAEWEWPKHRVKLTRSFRMGATPITNAQYRRFDPGHDAEAPDDFPVVNVTWYEAASFCRWAGVSLPTEAQWEYACRAGSTSRWWVGDHEEELGEVAWYGANSGHQLHAVGTKGPNPRGLFDMHGLVWEWCEDRTEAGEVPKAESDRADPAGPAGGSHRVVRGGACWHGAAVCRSAYRDWGLPSRRFGVRGFRVVLPSPQHG